MISQIVQRAQEKPPQRRLYLRVPLAACADGTSRKSLIDQGILS
ncbi:hypothetical protein ACRAWD_28875 [Caulobacter segnis]